MITLDAGVAQGLRAMGVSEADIAAEAAKYADPAGPGAADFEVHDDAWEAWVFFTQVQTQWVYRGLDGRRAGLCNPGVESALRMGGVRRALWPALWADMRVMELAVLEADGEMALLQQQQG